MSLQPLSKSNILSFAPGQRISLRGEDFLISDLQPNEQDGSYLLSVQGISELVRNKRFIFDTNLDSDIQSVDPAQTQLVADRHTGYRKTKLLLETAMRMTPTTSNDILIGHKAGIDVAGYQLKPTLKALELPRPRMLIADGVGLGKTIEVGIFLAEMMRRGKGKRILVLALKSILAQFQKEIWERFAIPLVRLDSEGISRLKSRLPLNKNPFDFYDKTIISIDTLKNNAKFRHYIEKSHWDIVVIDECHTVANIGSQRGELADYLSKHCDSLVLTSATPHNGKRANFANLISMIEPTAISDDQSFTKEDIEPYFVRRFKHHIKDDRILSNFKERITLKIPAVLDPLEEAFLMDLQQLRTKAMRHQDRENALTHIGFFKAFMSSPNAALGSLTRREEKLLEKGEKEQANEIGQLRKQVQHLVSQKLDSKYQAFKQKLGDMNWKGKPSDERIVLFAERIETLEYLLTRLKEDFNMPDERIKSFTGSLTDVEQEAMIEDFGKEDSAVRIMLCSDAGSQGVNLHYYCHHMFNYDLPWSLITLEQRNGRIDRYGQKNQPIIHYMVADSTEASLRTDFHIIDKLIEKEEVVKQTLGDAGDVTKLYDAQKEIQITTEAILQGNVDYLEVPSEADEWDDFFAQDAEPEADETQRIQAFPSLFASDEAFYQQLLEQLRAANQLESDDFTVEEEGSIEVVAKAEFLDVLYDLPPEALPSENSTFRLSTRPDWIKQSIENARKNKDEWAKTQVLYDLHPLMRYLTTKLEASVDKNQAMAARLTDRIPSNSAWYIFHGQNTNRLGQPVISDFFALGLDHEGALKEMLPLPEFISRFRLNETLYTAEIQDDHLQALQENLEDAVLFAQNVYLKRLRDEKTLQMEEQMDYYRERVRNWQKDRNRQLDLKLLDQGQNTFVRRRIEKEKREVTALYEQSSSFFNDYLTLKEDSFLKLMAVFYNRS